MEDVKAYVQELIDAPECFLEFSQKRRDNIASTIKTIYAHVIKQTEKASKEVGKNQIMPELMVKDFDTEQIWEQVELLNDPLIKQLELTVEELTPGKQQGPALPPELENKSKSKEDDDEDDDEDEDEDGLDNNVDANTNSKKGKEDGQNDNQDTKQDEQEEHANDKEVEDDEGGEEGLLDDDDMDSKGQTDTAEKKVDDRELEFFDEDELDEIADFDFRDGDFQILARQQEEKGEQEDEDDDNIDYNAPIDEGDAANFKYDDFFDKPRFKDPSTDAAEGDIQEEIDLDKLDPNDPTLSRHEREQLKLRQSIQSIEGKIVQPRSWEMSGEVSAIKRPENSLLETDLEFTMAQRLPEPVTEETTKELEDIIKQRIISEIWDDPERKEPPKQKAFKAKKELRQEKSEVGLAELYEREYVSKALGQDDNHEVTEELQEKHREIAVLISELNHKLDALSNFHFTPMPHVEEMKVTTKAPAISMEEVIPMGVSTSQTIAPQEEYQSKDKGMPTERSELTKSERKTKRNTKKKRARKRKRAKDQAEKLEAKTNSKKAVQLEIRRAKKSSILSDGREVDKNDYSKSSAFFAKIQASENSKMPKQKKKRSSNKAAKVKL